MCFSIDIHRQRRWTVRQVWKTVRIVNRRGQLRSMVMGSVDWNYPGERVEKSGGHPLDARLAWPSGRWHFTTRHGIYVFREEPPVHLMPWDCVPLLLEVDPEDFLYHNWDSTMGTYKAVTIAEDQPWIDWSKWS